MTIVYHIPVCPFCQRLEILLELKGCRDQVEFRVIDITVPRPDWLLEKTGGSTSLPVLETDDGKILRESLVILRYLDDHFSDRKIAQRDPYRHAVESMLVAMEGSFCTQGYMFVMNQDRARQASFAKDMRAQYARLNEFLRRHHADGTFLFEEFGWAEAVFTPFFMRFWFLEYYENFHLPDTEAYLRVRKWRAACLAHPTAQQVTREEIVKLYYDYALGAGNGALANGRVRSSFSLVPHWRDRPWPPKEKYLHHASDTELGLIVE